MTSSLASTTGCLYCYYECLRMIRVLVKRSDTVTQETRGSLNLLVPFEAFHLKL